MHGIDQALTANEARAWQRVSQLLQRLGEFLDMPLEVSRIHQCLADASRQVHMGGEGDSIFWMVRTANQLGLHIAPIEITFDDLTLVAQEGLPVARFVEEKGEGDWWLIHRASWGRFDVQIIRDSGIEERVITQRKLKKLLGFKEAGSKQLFFLAEATKIGHGVQRSSLWERDSHSGYGESSHGHGHHQHISPVSRLLAMIKLDSGDIGIITLFAVVIGLLGLATPLAVESLVNTVVFGRYVQPIIVLSLMLFVFLMFSGFLRILQSYTAEIIQRRMMVRVVGDLAHRIPRADIKQWDKVWGPELSNRFFDIVTLQKSVSTIFVDGISLVLQTVIGLALLGFYHPFLLGFDIVLIICVVVIILVLGRGGIQTAENESVVKYKVAHWLQDLAGSTTAFKIHGGRQLAVDRANRLMGEYVAMRSRHFRVLLRQNVAGMVLYAVASTALLGLGGWLVIQGRLSPGQLVAAELIVTVILGSFMKIGKQVETFFDLTAGVNKLGYLLDLETDPPGRVIDVGLGPAPVRWKNLMIGMEVSHKEMHFPDYEIQAGETVAIVGPSGYGKSLLAETLVGMRSPSAGYVEVEGIEAREASRLSDGGMAAIAGSRQVFHGTVAENIHLGRPTVTDADVRESLRKVLAWDEVLKLPEGMETPLLTGGRPLSSGQIDRLMIARAIAGSPRVLVLDGALDALPIDVRQAIWNNLTNPKTATIIVITNEPDIIQRCDKVLSLPGVGGSGVIEKLGASHAFA